MAWPWSHIQVPILAGRASPFRRIPFWIALYRSLPARTRSELPSRIAQQPVEGLCRYDLETLKRRRLGIVRTCAGGRISDARPYRESGPVRSHFAVERPSHSF